MYGMYDWNSDSQPFVKHLLFQSFQQMFEGKESHNTLGCQDQVLQSQFS